MGMTWSPATRSSPRSKSTPGSCCRWRSSLADLASSPGTRISATARRGGRGAGEPITSRTRVIAVSHVLWSTGAVLPLREISDLARQHELMVVVDGAQSAGRCRSICTLWASMPTRWPVRSGSAVPKATGLLYVRRDRFADIAPTYARYGQFEPSGYFIPAPGAMRYEIGEFYSPAVAAQEAALRWLRDEVGFDWAYDRIADARRRFPAPVDEHRWGLSSRPARRWRVWSTS